MPSRVQLLHFLAALSVFVAYSTGAFGAANNLQTLVDTSTGLVDLPAGTFSITEPIVVDTTKLGFRGIRGANGATRVVMAGPGPAFDIIGDHNGTADPTSAEDHTWDKERFPVISGFEILGAHPEADGIRLTKTMKCTIENMLFRKCRYGVHLVERNRNVIIADSHFYDGLDTGIFLDNVNLHQINILGNHISYNQRAGVRQLNGDVHNVQISGNDIEYNAGLEGSTGEIVLEASDGFISEYAITGNTIQARPEHSGENILINGPEKDTPYAARIISITGNIIGSRERNIELRHASLTTITGNTIYGGRISNVGIEQCSNIVLGNNTIGSRPTMHESMEIYDDGIVITNSADCTVTGNIMTGIRFGSAEAGGAIALRAATGIRVTNNQIIGPKWRGIDVRAGKGCVVSDNTIDQRDSTDMVAAITAADDAKDCLIRQNILRTALDRPVVAADGTADVDSNTIQRLNE